jgi:hypothetical protein
LAFALPSHHPRMNEDIVNSLAGSASMAASAVGHQSNQARRAEVLQQVQLLHCLFNNPFTPTRPDPSWQTTNAVTLARTMYETRDFTAMPLLADLLEEAGCPVEVSRHCRGPGPHARGFWVIDLLLGRE